jgi:filamentous hemagglutinin family protein
MNRIYSIVWNSVSACWQATAESARSHGKPGSTRAQTLLSTAILSACLGVSPTSLAGPTGGQVTAGSATINQSGSKTTINQSSQNAAINWQSFSVGKSESVQFVQPNATSITLNRVTGTESSQILGSLTANGRVFILNPNGVLFGKDAQVNVGGIVASTGRMSNADFMAGNYKITGATQGSVVNEGNIQAGEGGVIAFIAPLVQNTGTLNAPQGSVLLAGAEAVTLNLQDGSLIGYTLDKGSLQAMVDNGGLIQADGGHVVLTAKGLDALSRATVNHSGIIEAHTVANKNGIVELLGDMEVGQVNLSGKIDASAPNGGNGGFVETSAAQVSIADTAFVTTKSATGKSGTWLIDPLNFTISPDSLPRTAAGMGANTLSAALENGNVSIATSAVGGEAGNIYVNGIVAWVANSILTLTAHNSIEFTKSLYASGANAGLVLNPLNGFGSTFALKDGAVITLSGANATFAVSGQAYTVIHTITQLQAMLNGLSGRYALGNNIVATETSGWNGGQGFQPIGQGANVFTGTMNGLGHQVQNLYINRPTEREVGLFGSVEGSLRNIGLTNASVIGLDAVGPLAGLFRYGASVHNAFATGNASGRDGIGGLIGVATPYHYGGFSWCASCIFIDQTYANVTVYSKETLGSQSQVGGLVSGIDQTIISNSYAQGSVTSDGSTVNNIAGGLVSHSWGSSIINSYATGAVQGGYLPRTGGLVGLQNGYTSSSYFDSQTTGQSGGSTTAAMKQQATFAGWDFSNVWQINSGEYPTLRNAPPLMTPAVTPFLVPGNLLTAPLNPDPAVVAAIIAARNSAANSGSAPDNNGEKKKLNYLAVDLSNNLEEGTTNRLVNSLTNAQANLELQAKGYVQYEEIPDFNLGGIQLNSYMLSKAKQSILAEVIADNANVINTLVDRSDNVYFNNASDDYLSAKSVSIDNGSGFGQALSSLGESFDVLVEGSRTSLALAELSFLAPAKAKISGIKSRIKIATSALAFSDGLSSLFDITEGLIDFVGALKAGDWPNLLDVSDSLLSVINAANDVSGLKALGGMADLVVGARDLFSSVKTLNYLNTPAKNLLDTSEIADISSLANAQVVDSVKKILDGFSSVSEALGRSQTAFVIDEMSNLVQVAKAADLLNLKSSTSLLMFGAPRRLERNQEAIIRQTTFLNSSVSNIVSGVEYISNGFGVSLGYGQ